MRGRGRGRVVHDADDRPFGALAQEFGDEAGGVRGRAGAGIVLRVGENDRSRRGSCDAKGLAHGVIDRQRAMGGKARLGRDERREQTIGGGVDRRLIRAIGRDARADVADVGRREAHVEGEMHAGLRLDALQLLVELLRRLDIGAAGGDRHEERCLPERARRALPGEHAVEPFGAASAGGAPVDMGIGAVGGNEVRRRDHRGRDVGVQVERHQDRHVRTDGVAHAGEQLALAVVVVFRHHRAVQLEEDRVRLLAAQPVDHDPGHALEGVARDLAARHRPAPGERDHDVPGLLGRIHEIGDREIDAPEGRKHAFADGQRRPRPGLHEVVPGRRFRDESISLVHEPADRDPQTHSPSPKRAPPRAPRPDEPLA